VASLESQARYIIRPALAIDALEKRDNGSLAMQTPPDPRTGATILVFDSLEWIYHITQIPDPGQHNQRYYGPIASGPEYPPKACRISLSPQLKPARRMRIPTLPGRPVGYGPGCFG
jgi:hypothetical protein